MDVTAAIRAKLRDKLIQKCTRCNKEKSIGAFFIEIENRPIAKRCFQCREKVTAYHAKWILTPTGSASTHAANTKFRKTEAWQQIKARHKATQKYQDTKDAYEPRKKELRKIDYERIHSSLGSHLQHGIGVKISAMVSGRRSSRSGTLVRYTDFRDNDDLLEHFESMFEEGMTLDNYGTLRNGEERRCRKLFVIARISSL